MKIVLGLIGLLNVYTFWLMGVDKARARSGKWRVPEKTLLLWSACFGALGGTLGMYAFRHKTLHPRFRYGLPVLLAAQIAIGIVLYALYARNYV